MPGIGRIDPGKLESQIQAWQSPAPAPPPQAAPQQTAPAAVGPTGKWARLAQVGVGKVNLFNAYREVTHSGQPMNANNSLLKSGVKAVAGVRPKNVVNAAKDVGQGIVSGVTDVASQANKNIIKPLITQPQKGPGVSNIMQAQAAAQAAQKSDKVSPQAMKALDQIQSPYDKVTAYRIVANQNLNPQQMKQQMMPIIQKQSSQVKKALGDTLQLASLAVGGGETKSVITGERTLTGLTKAATVNTASGATGNVGSKLSENPNATKKELVGAAKTGAEFGAATTALSAGVGKLASGIKTTLGKDKTANATIATAKQNALLQKAKQANTADTLGKTATKAPPTNIPVKTTEQKLLGPGGKTGAGFTMSEKVNPAAISTGQEIRQLENRLTKFQQGKLQITPVQAKADAARLSDLKSGKVSAAQKLTGTNPQRSQAAEISPEKPVSLDQKVSKPSGAPKVSLPLSDTNKSPSKGVGKLVNTVANKTKKQGYFNPEQGLNRAGHTDAAQVVREISANQELAGYKGAIAMEKAKRLGLDKQSYEQVAKNIESGNTKDAAHQHFVTTLQDTGKRGVQAGTLDAARGAEYVPRYAKFNDTSGGGSIGGLRKTGGFSKARVQAGEFGEGGDKYATYGEFKQAVQKGGGKVTNASASEVLGHTVTSREKAIANATGLTKLEHTAMKDGQPAVVSYSPAKGLNSKYAGYNTSLLDGRAVHPNLVPAIKSLMIDNNTFKGIGKVNSFTKRLITVNGVIHDLNYARSSIGEQGLLKTVTHAAPANMITKGIENPKYAANTERMMQHGVVFSRMGKTNIFDEANNGANSLGKQVNGVLGKTRAKMDNVVFGVGDNLGRSTFLKVEKGLLGKGLNQKEAGQLAADAANRVMFTQRATESSQEMQNVGKVALFAKNFFQSTLQKATAATGISKNNALSQGAQRAGQVQAAKAMARTFAYLFTAAQAINYHATGHSTLQNKDSKISPVFYVDKTTGKAYHITNWYGQIGELLHITQPKALFSKVSPSVQEISRLTMGVLGAKDPFTGNTIIDKNASGIRQWGQVAANALEHLVTPVGIDQQKAQQMFGKGGQPGKVSATNLLGFGTSTVDQNTFEKDIMNQYYATLPAGASKTPPAESALKAAARNDLAKGNTNSNNLQQLKSQMTSKQYQAFVKTGADSQVQTAFDKLPTEQKLNVIEKYSPQQLQELNLTGVAKSFVDTSSKNTIQSLQSKGYSTQRIQQDLQKVGITSDQLKQVKTEAKKQAAIASKNARKVPKFVNPFIK